MKLHWSFLGFFVGPIAAFLHANAWSGSLPERVATHFGANGDANGWMSRSSALTFYVGMVAGLNLLFLGISALLGVLPASVVNLPNRDYWLAPERRAATVQKMSMRMAILALGISAYMITIFNLTFQAATLPHPTLAGSGFGLYMVGFFLLLGLWIASLLVAFRMPKNA